MCLMGIFFASCIIFLFSVYVHCGVKRHTIKPTATTTAQTRKISSLRNIFGCFVQLQTETKKQDVEKENLFAVSDANLILIGQERDNFVYVCVFVGWS